MAATAAEAAPADMQRDVEVRELRKSSPVHVNITLTRARRLSWRRVRPMSSHLRAAALLEAMPSRLKTWNALRRPLTTWTSMAAMQLVPPTSSSKPAATRQVLQAHRLVQPSIEPEQWSLFGSYLLH